MAKTALADVIVPEVFAPYVLQRSRELSTLLNSGIAVRNPDLDALVEQGGKLLNMPFWKPLSGSSQVLSDTAPMVAKKIAADKDVAALRVRGDAWSANQLAGALAGSDPMAAIADQLAAYWDRQDQADLVATLTGAFSATNMTGSVNDISAGAGAAAVIGANAVLDTKQLLGDSADQLTAIAMHSAVYTTLQKQNLITYIPNARGEVNIPTYLGYRVIVSDALPVAAGVYSTFLLAAGSIGYGSGNPASLKAVSVGEDILASDDILANRRAYVIHPYGVKWNNTTVVGATPTDAELATAANWTRVYDTKAVGMAMLKHKIG
jgi:Major capsid protein 13-like